MPCSCVLSHLIAALPPWAIIPPVVESVKKWITLTLTHEYKKKLLWTISEICGGNILFQNSAATTDIFFVRAIDSNSSRRVVRPWLETGSMAGHTSWQREWRSMNTPVPNDYCSVNIYSCLYATRSLVAQCEQAPHGLEKKKILSFLVSLTLTWLCLVFIRSAYGCVCMCVCARLHSLACGTTSSRVSALGAADQSKPASSLQDFCVCWPEFRLTSLRPSRLTWSQSAAVLFTLSLHATQTHCDFFPRGGRTWPLRPESRVIPSSICWVRLMMTVLFVKPLNGLSCVICHLINTIPFCKIPLCCI